MWALINKSDNSITEILSFPKAVTIDSITHPKEIFNLWSGEDLNNIGIYTIEATTGIKDERFYNNSEPEYKFDSTNKKVTSTVTTTEKSLDDLKTSAKEQAKRTANFLIHRFNWLVERFVYDSSKTIPTTVINYVKNIRADCVEIETAIDNCSNITELEALYTDELNSDGSIKTICRMNKWTSDSTVIDYIR
tara:strand:- start:1383 stop:1958 length:576 start_codon:yes stop_codon:yes gene_type:complete